jgi:hypothetical protein
MHMHVSIVVVGPENINKQRIGKEMKLKARRGIRDTIGTPRGHGEEKDGFCA